MKKAITIILLILFFTHSNAQQSTDSVIIYKVSTEDLLLKANKLKTAGWCFLATGTVLSAVGYAIYPKDYNWLFEDNKNHDNEVFAATVLTVLGVAAMITSIPLFATAASKKHQVNLAVRNEKAAQIIPGRGGKNMAALSLNISLGKHH